MELFFCALEDSGGRGVVNWIDEIIWVLKKKSESEEEEICLKPSSFHY